MDDFLSILLVTLTDAYVGWTLDFELDRCKV